MSIASQIIVTMVNINAITVSALTVGYSDYSVGGGENRSTGFRGEIKTGMKFGASVDRITPHAIARRHGEILYIDWHNRWNMREFVLLTHGCGTKLIERN